MWSDAADRYRTPIADIFSAESKLKNQLKVEVALSEIQAELGIIKSEYVDQIKSAASQVTVDRVQEIEREIHHDLMSMVKALTEKAGEAGKYVHYGATSNDIQDTVLALQLVETKSIILDLIDNLSNVIAGIALENKDIACIGRTHGQFAIPTTVGFKFANFLHELYFAKKEVQDSVVNISKFSGAVGNYASTMRIDIEENLLNRLNLIPCPISTQVVPRVFHAKFLNSLALVASVIERISKEIRNLQRSEINEWQEPFSKKQVGSSAMPHKRNPHKSERISGLVRIIRSNVSIGLENISLEHERDISHSSVERVIIPQTTNLIFYVVNSMKSILEGLELNYNNIEKNLIKADKGKSEQILTEMTESIGRQEAHELLRKHIESDNFKQSVINDGNILEHITRERLVEIFEEVKVGLASEKVEKIILLHNNEWSTYRS